MRFLHASGKAGSEKKPFCPDWFYKIIKDKIGDVQMILTNSRKTF